MPKENAFSKTLNHLGRTLHDMVSITPADVEAARREVQEAVENRAEIQLEATATDVKAMGKIASSFVNGMDHMSTVLMLLVLKFGRATTMLRIVFISGFIGLAALIVFGIINYNTVTTQAAILEEHQRMFAELRSVQKKQDELLKQFQEAKKQAGEAQELAPTVVVDTAGKAKLVVPQPATPRAAGGKVEIPLDTH